MARADTIAAMVDHLHQVWADQPGALEIELIYGPTSTLIHAYLDGRRVDVRTVNTDTEDDD